MHTPLLWDIAVIFGLLILVVLACHRARIPSIVGFLLTGVLAGPQGLGLITNLADVEIFSKIGIALLLFTIGVEFSLKQVFRYKRYFLAGGAIQVLLTVLAGFTISTFLNRPPGETIFLGCLLSLSSTAIVLRLFEARSEMASSQAKLSTAILIFQDFMVVPMMLSIPFLAGAPLIATPSVSLLLLKAFGLVLAVIVLSTYVVPKLLHAIAKTHSRELFLLTILTICLSVAIFADWIGLSLSIGAFLAGLIVSESEYSYQALGDIIPLQDIFISIFFVSTGMLINLQFLLAHLPLVLATTCGVMLLKWSITTLTGVAIGVPLRTVLLSAFALCQVGEFSFILAKTGLDMGLGTPFYFQLFLSVTFLSMGITPFLIERSHVLTQHMLRLPWPLQCTLGFRPIEKAEVEMLDDHLIIIGFGVCGKNLATCCKRVGIPYSIVDINAQTVRREKKKNEPISFGDATHEVILKGQHIQRAKAIAIAINDPLATVGILQLARKLAPALYIICRTRYVEEAKMLFENGADEVIFDELGSSIELMTRIMHYYHIPGDEIESLEAHIMDLFAASSKTLFRSQK